MSFYLEFSNLKPNEIGMVVFSGKSFQNGCFFRFFIHFSSKPFQEKATFNRNYTGNTLFDTFFIYTERKSKDTIFDSLPLQYLCNIWMAPQGILHIYH